PYRSCGPARSGARTRAPRASGAVVQTPVSGALVAPVLQPPDTLFHLPPRPEGDDHLGGHLHGLAGAGVAGLPGRWHRPCRPRWEPRAAWSVTDSPTCVLPRTRASGAPGGTTVSAHAAGRGRDRPPD